MNDTRTRVRKLRVLSRLRELEKDAAVFAHLRDRQILQQRQQVALAQQRRYEAAHAGGPRLDPDSHDWRLAAIAVLRSVAQTAAMSQREAAEQCETSRRELAAKRMARKVAESAEAAARVDARQEAERSEQVELLDVQLFRRRA